MENKNKNGKKALWIIIALIVVAAVAAWCIYNALNVEEGVKTEKVIKFSTVTALLVGIFVITALGYLLGSVSVKGVSLGSGDAPVARVREWAIQNNILMVVESEGLDPTGIEEVERCIAYLRSLEA